MCKNEILNRELAASPSLEKKYQREKRARLYYQKIVYAVCRALDAIDGYCVASGKGIVCGTAETPSDQVEKRLVRLVRETPKALAEYKPGTYCDDIKCQHYNEGRFSENCDKCGAFSYYLWLKEHGYKLVNLS